MEHKVSDLERKLSEANGALGDIYTLVTSCVGKSKNEELNKTCYSVVKRIMLIRLTPKPKFRCKLISHLF